MAQVYFLSILYLFFSSCLLLVDKYGSTFLFLINLKSFYNSKKTYPVIFMITGLVISICLLLFPMDPGPVILGDFLPAITILIVVFYFFHQSHKNEPDIIVVNNEKRNALGFIALGVAIIHFLFPFLVII